MSRPGLARRRTILLFFSRGGRVNALVGDARTRSRIRRYQRSMSVDANSFRDTR